MVTLHCNARCQARLYRWRQTLHSPRLPPQDLRGGAARVVLSSSQGRIFILLSWSPLLVSYSQLLIGPSSTGYRAQQYSTALYCDCTVGTLHPTPPPPPPPHQSPTDSDTVRSACQPSQQSISRAVFTASSPDSHPQPQSLLT